MNTTFLSGKTFRILLILNNLFGFRTSYFKCLFVNTRNDMSTNALNAMCRDKGGNV